MNQGPQSGQSFDPSSWWSSQDTRPTERVVTPPMTPPPMSATYGGRHCGNCGAVVAEGAAACLRCGFHPARSQDNCRHCGTPMQPRQAICVRCGFARERGGVSAKVLAIVAAATVCMLALGGAAFALSGSGGTKSVAKPRVAISTPPKAPRVTTTTVSRAKLNSYLAAV